MNDKSGKADNTNQSCILKPNYYCPLCPPSYNNVRRHFYSKEKFCSHMLMWHNQYVPVCASNPTQEQILNQKQFAKRETWKRASKTDWYKKKAKRIARRRYNEEPKYRARNKYKVKRWYFWTHKLAKILDCMYGAIQ